MSTTIKDGWTYTITETFQIKSIANFNSVENWVSFHEKHPTFKGNGRHQCSCCGRSWKKIATGNVWLCIMVNKVNQSICDECVKQFDHLIIRRVR